ncbi:MAG: hypothetical protein V8R91_01285 [Butyricimonas faecihominis]
MIFKERGINRFANEDMFDRMGKPSFVSLYLGLNIPLSGYDIDEQSEFRTSSGSWAGVEGAYFSTRTWVLVGASRPPIHQ